MKKESFIGMKCDYCGSEIPEGRRFCGVCGADQTGVNEEKTVSGNGFSENVAQHREDASAENTNGTSALNNIPGGSGSPQPESDNPVNQNYINRMEYTESKRARGKSKNLTVLASAIGIIMVISAITVAVGVFGFGWFGDKSPKKDPAETVEVAVNAVNRNDSKTFFNCLMPDIRNNTESSLKSVTSGFGTMFGGQTPNSYELLDKTLEYAKFILGIERVELNRIEVKEGEVNGSAVVTGDLYLGTMNVGRAGVELEMADGIWYISGFDAKNLKIDEIIKQFSSAGNLFEKNRDSSK